MFGNFFIGKSPRFMFICDGPIKEAHCEKESELGGHPT
jgi:hypothetical protein